MVIGIVRVMVMVGSSVDKMDAAKMAARKQSTD